MGVYILFLNIQYIMKIFYKINYLKYFRYYFIMVCIVDVEYVEVFGNILKFIQWLLFLIYVYVKRCFIEVVVI